MNRPQQNHAGQNPQFVKGLPLFTASDPQALSCEKAQLMELDKRSFLRRWQGYFQLTGPGWVQSALTLGGGSAVASLFAGRYLQYSLLWVQPLAMVLGVIMLAAISHQTLSTRARPFSVISEFFHPLIAWAWALGALLVCIIWHFPQYALAAGMVEDMIAAVRGKPLTGVAQTSLLVGIGLMVLVISTWITWNYGKGHKGVRLYERILKGMVAVIIVSFAIVVVRRAWDGGIEWSKVAKGFLPLEIPTDKKGVSIVMAAFAAVVGINSTFLFPYTLLARGWGKEHEGLSRFDLISGMLIPFCLITSFIIIAAGCTIYEPGVPDPSQITPIQAAEIFQAAGLGLFFSRIVFGIGIIGMALTTLTVHMLLAGLAACELLGVEPGGWKYKLASLLPAPGVSGVILWKYMGPWIAIPTSAVCGILLPFAYVLFIILHNKKAYLGTARPEGLKRLLWNLGMSMALATSIASVCYFVYLNYLN